MNSIIIGRRLKYFRQRAKLSQMELELKMDAAFGTVSRIESGRVNPSKESIYKITNILNLNNFELDYLTGITAKPASKEEIEAAKLEVKDFFIRKFLHIL